MSRLTSRWFLLLSYMMCVSGGLVLAHRGFPLVCAPKCDDGFGLYVIYCLPVCIKTIDEKTLEIRQPCHLEFNKAWVLLGTTMLVFGFAILEVHKRHARKVVGGGV